MWDCFFRFTPLPTGRQDRNDDFCTVIASETEWNEAILGETNVGLLRPLPTGQAGSQ